MSQNESVKEFEPSPKVFEKLKSLVEQKNKEKILREMPVVRTPIVVGPKTGRNDPCPCGSGIKYKKCCMLKDKKA